MHVFVSLSGSIIILIFSIESNTNNKYIKDNSKDYWIDISLIIVLDYWH